MTPGKWIETGHIVAVFSPGERIGMTQKQVRKLPVAEFVIITLLFVIIAGSMALNFFEPLEVKTLDARYKRIEVLDPQKDIVLVTINEEDIDHVGEWPWPRGIHARLVRTLSEAGAKVIGFDVFFDTASTDVHEDELFVDACRDAGNVVTALYFNETTQLPQAEPSIEMPGGTSEIPIYTLQSEGEGTTTSIHVSRQFTMLNSVLASQGIVDLGYNRLNPDGIIRFVDISFQVNDRRVHSLGLELARQFLDQRSGAVELKPDSVQIPGHNIPLFHHSLLREGRVVGESPFIIRYTGPLNLMFNTVPYSAVLEKDFPTSYFKNKIVLVGASAEAFFDIKRTPFGSAPGMNINALITRSILENDYLYRPQRVMTLFQMLLLAVFCGYYLIRVKPSFWDIVLLGGFIFLWWQLALFTIVKWSWLLEVVAPIVLVVSVIILTRFWQMFIRLHLSNMALSKSNKLLDARVHELETLFDLSNSIQDVSDMKRINRTFLSKSMGVVGANHGVYLTYDETSEKLALEETLHPGEPPEGLADALTQLGREMLGQKTVCVLDSGHELFRKFNFDQFGIGCLLFSPLRTKREELIAQLILARRSDEPVFVKEDERVIYLASLQAGSVIENTKLYLMAVIDGLTQLYVRRYFDARLTHEVRRHKRYGGELSLLLMDIDHFKNFNDTYGHQTGDLVLKDVARLVVESLRDVDLAARYGGEELCVLLPETPRPGAVHVAERIRKSIEENRSVGPEGEQLQVTISIGVCVFDDGNMMDPEDMVKFADVAMYQSKENGRNRVTLYDPETMGGKDD